MKAIVSLTIFLSLFNRKDFLVLIDLNSPFHPGMIPRCPKLKLTLTLPESFNTTLQDTSV